MTCHDTKTFTDNRQCRIFLVRHAQSMANVSKLYTGWTDVELSELGEQQARKGRAYFDGIALDAIYASSLRRAYNTAEIIFGENADISRVEEFKEMQLGQFEGKTHDELLAEFPELYRRWIDDPTSSDIPDGETIQRFFDRVTGGLKKIIAENSGKNIAIVAHGGVIRCMVMYVLNMRLSDVWKIKVDNVSVSRIEFLGDKKALTLLNDTSHLREDA